MNATGHMLVAKIAWDVMTPAAREAVSRLASVEGNPISDIPTKPFDNDAFTAACYMDDIRPVLSGVHFDDTLIDERGKPLPTQHDNPNAVTFCKDMMALMRDPKATPEQRAEAMRYTMHLTADLHQPLHCVSRVTPQNPEGDRGGNLFPIQWANRRVDAFCCCGGSGHTHPVSAHKAAESTAEDPCEGGHGPAPGSESPGPTGANLHGYWDSAAGTFERIERPLSPAGLKKLTDMAIQIERQYPMAIFGVSTVKELNPQSWQEDGVALAGHDCYKGIKPGERPSKEYRQIVVNDMRRQTALAGYRLGTFYNEVFK